MYQKLTLTPAEFSRKSGMRVNRRCGKMIPTMQETRQQIISRIQQAAEQAGVHRSVRLVAVSKRQSIAAIRALYHQGQRDFGENYLQEAAEKIKACQDLDITWHFLGAIQSNKTRAIAEQFDWVHTVDRLKIARRLAEQRPGHLGAINVLLQVNIDDQPSKAGASVAEVPQLVEQVRSLAGLRLKGLMCIPAPGNTAAFAQLAKLNATLPDPLPELSMGMSGDYPQAIQAGASMVRIGTALFGPRD